MRMLCGTILAAVAVAAGVAFAAAGGDDVVIENAQYRIWRNLDPQPILGEGAAKAHFGWHMLSGANAFDVFFPEEFKAKIDEYPAAEAPLMQRDFTRVNFGWWGFWAPMSLVQGKPTIGVQPDMWEYGTSKAAAWDSPVSVQMRLDVLDKHPRTDDILEVMRRWEDVRAKNWLSPTQKEALKSSTQGHHLYLNEKGEYELHEIEMLPAAPKAPHLRGFVFERGGRRVVACWHTCGSGRASVAIGENSSETVLELGGLRYLETDLPRDAVRGAFASAKEF